jgi:hypothetical protein
MRKTLHQMIIDYNELPIKHKMGFFVIPMFILFMVDIILYQMYNFSACLIVFGYLVFLIISISISRLIYEKGLLGPK